MTGEEQRKKPREVSFEELLINAPPGSAATVEGMCQQVSKNRYELLAPTMRLWCGSEHCEDYRFFTGEWLHGSDIWLDSSCYNFLKYRCNNCGQGVKTYALFCILAPDGTSAVRKYGEFPPQHIDVPSSLRQVVGEEQDSLNNGLQCERLGLGRGAFAYYRRIIETQWHRLLEKIIDVAAKLKASQEAQQILQEARTETQFSKGVDMVKNAVPKELFLEGGHNPVTLVHTALSFGIHELPDDECLSLATHARKVLTNILQQMDAIHYEEQGLKDSVSELLKTIEKRGKKESK